MSTLFELELYLMEECRAKARRTVWAASHRGDQIRRDFETMRPDSIYGDFGRGKPAKRTRVAHRLLNVERMATTKRIRQQLEEASHDPAQENEQA